MASAGVIGGSLLSCEFEIPPPPQGESFDPDEVNVEFSDGIGNVTPIGRVDDEAGCAQVSGGWYYDDLANPTTILMSPPAAVIAFVYPFFKRFFALPQAFLGIAFSFGIPMAFAAVFDEVPALAWWMLAANLFWVIAYDTEYAMVDRDDDLRLGLRTSAIAFGRFDVAAVMLCYAVFLAGMAAIGSARSLGPLYYAGLVAALGCALWHYRLIRGRDRMRCFAAFLHNHWLGFAVFAGVAADSAWRLHTWPRGF